MVCILVAVEPAHVGLHAGVHPAHHAALRAVLAHHHFRWEANSLPVLHNHLKFEKTQAPGPCVPQMNVQFEQHERFLGRAPEKREALVSYLFLDGKRHDNLLFLCPFIPELRCQQRAFTYNFANIDSLFQAFLRVFVFFRIYSMKHSQII